MQALSVIDSQSPGDNDDTSAGGPALGWWRGAVGYEIYIRSFSDSSGDGVGDLQGIIDRLDHLAWLGIDVLWITPFYPTPDHDHGYDVADYCDIDPRFGTLDIFDRLVAQAHDRGLRVFIDIVPNHCSSQHPWFRSALSDPDSPYRDYFVWRDPAADGGPPNNWVSYFGGPAWTLDPASGQYYLHLFLPEQPDLNWATPAVRDEFDAILRFWCDRGVDGFRIDVCQGIMKHPEFPDNPQIRPLDDAMGPVAVFESFEHRYDLGQPETVDVFRRWHNVVESYGVVLLGELGVWDPEIFSRYVCGGDALDAAFALEPGLTPWDTQRQLDVILAMHAAAGPGIAWEVTNHDQRRAPSRFGGGDVGLRRALALLTLTVCLDGMPFLYQGDELGLEDGIVAAGHLADPISVRNPGSSDGRDSSRTPMPWDDGPGNGFTTSPTAWLPSAPRAQHETVEFQRFHAHTPLHHYRSLANLRRAYPRLWQGPIEHLSRDQEFVQIRRPGVWVLSNLSEEAIAAPAVPDGWRVAFQSWPVPGPSDPEGNPVPGLVAAETTIVLVESSPVVVVADGPQPRY